MVCLHMKCTKAHIFLEKIMESVFNDVTRENKLADFSMRRS